MFTIQKILSGGRGGGLRVLKTLFYFFTEASADLASLSKEGVVLLFEVVNNSISKETYNNL